MVFFFEQFFCFFLANNTDGITHSINELMQLIDCQWREMKISSLSLYVESISSVLMYCFCVKNRSQAHILLTTIGYNCSKDFYKEF